MRFSIINLLLLGTALGAPTAVADHEEKALQHDSHIARGLVPILPRFAPVVKPIPIEPVKPIPIEPVKPIPIEPVKPPVGPVHPPGGLDAVHVNPDTISLRPGEPGAPAHPGEPGAPAHLGEPGAPTHLGEPGAPAHPGEPETPAIRPDDPNAPVNKAEDPNLPGLRPEEPKPKPAPGRGGCLKRGGCALDGADPGLKIDSSYERSQWDSDPSEIPTGPFRTAGDDNDGWRSTIIDNNRDTKDKFASETIPAWTEELKQNGWKDTEIEALKSEMATKFGPNGASEMTKTHEKPKENGGAIIVEDSKNEEMDLHRPFKGTIRIGRGASSVTKEYTRPAVDEQLMVKQSKMIGDNYATAAASKNLDPKTLREVNAYDITTTDTRIVLDDVLKGKTEATFAKDTEEFNKIRDKTVHGNRPHALVAQPRYTGLEVKDYQVWVVVSGRATRQTRKYFMKAHVAPA